MQETDRGVLTAAIGHELVHIEQNNNYLFTGIPKYVAELVAKFVWSFGDKDYYYYQHSMELPAYAMQHRIRDELNKRYPLGDACPRACDR